MRASSELGTKRFLSSSHTAAAGGSSNPEPNDAVVDGQGVADDDSVDDTTIPMLEGKEE